MEPRAYGPFPYSPITERPALKWPGGARIALWVAPNIEFFPLDEKVFMGIGIVPDVLSWSHREYGNRVGIWRIMEVLDRYGIRATVALNSEVCDACPQIVTAGVERGWEFMGHNQSNSRPLNQIDPEREGEVVSATFDRIEKATGKRPRGWLSGGLIETWNTLDHLIDAGCEYVCDWVVDDQPWCQFRIPANPTTSAPSCALAGRPTSSPRCCAASSMCSTARAKSPERSWSLRCMGF
jgi:hypothetical protein